MSAWLDFLFCLLTENKVLMGIRMIRSELYTVKKSNALRTGLYFRMFCLSGCPRKFPVETTRGLTLLQIVTKELDVVLGVKQRNEKQKAFL